MSTVMVIQLVGSAVAVAALVGLVAWARLARPTPPLDAEGAVRLLAEEFPDDRVDAVWLAADSGGLIARSGDLALVLWRRGDGYVARSASWADVIAADVDEGRIKLRAIEGAPALAVGDGPWPPTEVAA
ncbi:hypothetical protein [Caulobacter endophyticus]|uniref:hypothetical protein n=1 Tax=Caulobacter endophyticus TaxID=2172652 RepID=UPI00240EEFC0|nr:hypothetical protein [Caulobacter endophyticus]MDG2527379.1 hypothetical protein [Caulobacter endophyticus]